jgi:arabinose-5-phosphate isomerase
MTTITDHDLLQYGVEVINTEIKEVEKMATKLDESFIKAVKAIMACEGKVVISGMGKSGHIAKKISATFSSTGTSSIFLHPAEAYHGDLGVIHPQDVIILISNSGETDEILKIIPFLQDQENYIIAFSGKTTSTLAVSANCSLDVGVEVEACSLNLAPTSSTTATLVMGDALAVAVMKAKGFKQEEFARFHPGGNLGRRLLTRVKNAMVTENLPFIALETNALDTMHQVSAGRLGLAIVISEDRKLQGIITDGDIRRALVKNKETIFILFAKDIMTKNPRTTNKELRLTEAEELMDGNNIHQLVVVDENNRVEGILPYRKSKS